MKKRFCIWWISVMLVVSGCARGAGTPVSSPTGAATITPFARLQVTRSVVQTTPTVFVPTFTPAVERATPTLPPTVTQTPIPPAPPPPGWIAFWAFKDGYENIYIVHTGGIGLRSIISSVMFPENPAWSPDGQWLAFLGSPTRYSEGQIYLARPDGSEIKRLTFTPGHKNSLSWSPDGRKIVYSQTYGPSGQVQVDLFVYELDGPRIRQLTNTPGVYEHYPAFSPKGDAIAFMSVQEGAEPHMFNLMSMNPDGSNVKQLTEGLDIGGFAWSPNGSQMAITVGERCHYDLYVANSVGKVLKRLTDNAKLNFNPVWSPDGEWIAFEQTICNEAGTRLYAQTQNYLFRSDGSGLRELTNDSSFSLANPA